jgi:hypothetical protein
MSIENLVKRASVSGINSPSSVLYWSKWFEGYMMRGECEKIRFGGETYTLEVFHIGNNRARKERVFWVLREKRYFYEMKPYSYNSKGEESFLLPWDLIDRVKEGVLKDLNVREELKGSVV